MKVLLINGSTVLHGCVYRALTEMATTFAKENVETEIVELGPIAYHDCIGCYKCQATNKCVFDDKVNEVLTKVKDCDGVVFGSPVYYSHASGTILSFLDRLFMAGKSVFAHKVGANIVTLRRAGSTHSLADLNQYMLISNMYLVGSSYWNMVHGNTKEEIEQDLEGLQTMRNLTKNMTYLMKALELSKDKLEVCQLESGTKTNFIR